VKVHSERPVAIDAREGVVVAHLGGVHEVTGNALIGGGFGQAERVAILAVRNTDLGPEVDPAAFARASLAAQGVEAAVVMMTSRRPLVHHRADAERDGCHATALVTAGMSNALCVGDPAGRYALIGTINVLCHVDVALGEAARLEALAIAVEARTRAVLERGVPSIASGLPSTGTGTDCVTIASALEGPRAAFAGKHTALGEVIGRATYEATREALGQWLEERARAEGGAR
jgi:adenosylcobinamide amidohydrolase